MKRCFQAYKGEGSLRSIIRTFGSAEGAFVDLVFKCHDSAN